MHLWQTLDYATNQNYSPQTSYPNFFNPKCIPSETDMKNITPHHLAIAQMSAKMTFGQQNYPTTYMPSTTTNAPATTSSQPPAKKKPKPVPEEEKNIAYRDRRNKNNESAKKSREARRKKEEEKDRAIHRLQHENEYLKWQIYQLTTQAHMMSTMSSTDSSPPQMY